MTVRTTHRDTYHSWALQLQSPDQEVALTMLKLSCQADGYRIALANWSDLQLQTLIDGDFNMSVPQARLILAKAHGRMRAMVDEIWRTRNALLGHPVYYASPKSCAVKYYVVTVGRVPGLYYQYHEAHEQIHQFPSNSYRVFKSLIRALEYQSTKAAEHVADLAAASHVNRLELYTDGSYIAEPPRARWAFLVLDPRDIDLPPTLRVPLFESSGEVTLQEQSGLFLGATHLSNNTAEISALGEAYRWLGNQALLVRQLNVTDITIRTDSTCAMNALRSCSKPKANARLIRAIRTMLTLPHSA